MANRPHAYMVYMTLQKVIDQLGGPMKGIDNDTDFSEEINSLIAVRKRLSKKLHMIDNTELSPADEESTIDSQGGRTIELAREYFTKYRTFDGDEGKTLDEINERIAQWDTIQKEYKKCNPEEKQQVKQYLQDIGYLDENYRPPSY